MKLEIEGARENNLKDVNVTIQDGITVVTGVSGSGKSSLVFSTLYHESRRRFLDIFARGRTKPRLNPAKVRKMTGIVPTIAIEQNILNRNPNSILATASGLHPFLRLLYTHFGKRICPKCGTVVFIYSVDELVDIIRKEVETRGYVLLAPMVNNIVGSHKTLLKYLQDEFGENHVFLDGEHLGSLCINPLELHTIDVKLGKLDHDSATGAIRDMIQKAKSLGAYSIKLISDKGEEKNYAYTRVCTKCGYWLQDLKPVLFNKRCHFCQGEGCEACLHTGIHPQAASVTWKDYKFPDLLKLSIDAFYVLIKGEYFPTAANRLKNEIFKRVEALRKVGLGYIEMNRSSPTLSRGESQRVRLAISLTNQLEDLLHILDEPTIGLSINDVQKLIPAFRSLTGSVVFVEHDRIAASQADFAIDIGPDAGSSGGEIVFTGSPRQLWDKNTHTGNYFSFKKKVILPSFRTDPKNSLYLKGVFLRNLKNIDISIPLERLTVICGVSGSGKSTFAEDVLFKSLSSSHPAGCEKIIGPKMKAVMVDQSPIGKNPRSNPATYTGLARIIRDLFATHTPLTATYFSFNTKKGACSGCNGMGATEVKMRYLPSFWTRCNECDGQRFSNEVLDAKIKMNGDNFSIADFYSLTVNQVLEWLKNETELNLSKTDYTAAYRILNALSEIGLGYLALGQESPCLSGGEAQRVKLAKYLGQKDLRDKILILDEPTTGLHPHDISGLLNVLDRLVRTGATIVVVEHNSDFIRAADWIIDLGPGSGPDGGNLIYSGPVSGFLNFKSSITARSIKEEEMIIPSPGGRSKNIIEKISVKNAGANNLRNIDVEFPKAALNVVTGVSGSGKSTLLKDILQTEAERRYLETLSMYERQGLSEGPEAAVDKISGLGVTISVEAQKERFFYRQTVGGETEILQNLAILLSFFGDIICTCGLKMQRQIGKEGNEWYCNGCEKRVSTYKPKEFLPSSFISTCSECSGIGIIQVPMPNKLIIHPEKPLCGGAMYSPGFFPKGFLCKKYNSGYYFIRALGELFSFDPETTPWKDMSTEAQHAFLYGIPEKLKVTFESKKRSPETTEQNFKGFYGWIRDWDIGGTYTSSQPCPKCKGQRFKNEYLRVTIGGYNIHQLTEMPLKELRDVLESVKIPEIQEHYAAVSLETCLNRIGFLNQVGLHYLNLNRVYGTLSAGEAQRIKLARLLGSEMTSLTILIDEPTRGLHPSEVEALVNALHCIRDQGNTLIVIEHDFLVINSADYIFDLGPGPGILGGKIVFQGDKVSFLSSDSLTAQWMSGRKHIPPKIDFRKPKTSFTIKGAVGNNLKGELVKIPLEIMVGICGVSGSGKSTLLIDTLGRILAPKKQTTSVAYEPVEPEKYASVEGAPKRVVIIDQSKRQIYNPYRFLELDDLLISLYSESESAYELELNEKHFKAQCSACKGAGRTKLDMDFLPPIYSECESCLGTGLTAEIWDVKLHGYSLPELFRLTLDEIYDLFQYDSKIKDIIEATKAVGLGYLVLKQPGWTLSGGECQRLKIAKELTKKNNQSFFILDEPSIGQHIADVSRLIIALEKLVEEGNSVIIIEHHPHLLAACDYLIELGPEGGKKGGHIIACGTPDELAKMNTPTSKYLKKILENCK